MVEKMVGEVDRRSYKDGSRAQVILSVIADFTTPGESHLYGLPLSLYRLLRPLGPFFVL